MFELLIDQRGRVTVTAHPSREAALTALLRFLAADGGDYRVTEASREHSSYQLFARPYAGGRTRATGRALIDEICACGHPFTEHDEDGCAVLPARGELVGCRCRGYRPVPRDPTLFDISPEIPALPSG
jgi:hypothetical protein